MGKRPPQPRAVVIKTVDGPNGIQNQPRMPMGPNQPGHCKPGVGEC